MPIRHHYLPQTVIRKFYNEQGHFFLLDKRNNRISKQQSAKKIFQFEHLNTLVKQDGSFDDSSLERFFKYFEDDFNEHFSCIETISHEASSNHVTPILVSSKNEKSFKYFIKLGLIGYFRNPYVSAQRMRLVLSVLAEIFESDSKSIEVEESRMLHLDYLTLLEKSVELLGNAYVRILTPAPNHYFILPDVTGYYERANQKIEHVHDGNIMYEIKNHIKRMIIPISSGIIIEFDSVEYPSIKGSFIIPLSEKDTLLYNRMLFDSARHQLISSDREYLETFWKIMQTGPTF